VKPAGSTVVVVTYVAPGALTDAVLSADVYFQHPSRTAAFVASAALRRIASASAAVRCVEDDDAAVENAAKNALKTSAITTSAITISRSVSPRWSDWFIAMSLSEMVSRGAKHRPAGDHELK
jgi:hypothetical protein